jgi:hypothetical protein
MAAFSTSVACVHYNLARTIRLSLFAAALHICHPRLLVLGANLRTYMWAVFLQVGGLHVGYFENYRRCVVRCCIHRIK